MPALTIQLAAPDEIREIQALVNAAYSKWIDVIGGKPRPMTADYGTLIAQQRVYAVREEAELVAILVMWQEDDALYIDNLAVAPAHQQQGIGDRLLLFAEQTAREMNLPALTLITNEKMLYNQAYYLKHGFVELRRETLATDRRIVRMQKLL
ncbi:MAG: GNAT family N-acetyltransferase [Anaerolineae bacterium]|nr:GNAT family N-acetyltransferase [Anaerolineae bacterium]